MRIKPTNIRVYVEYECSQCGSFYNSYRLEEVKGLRLECPECGRVDRPEQLTVDVGYNTGEHTSVQVTCNLQSDDVKNAKTVLRSIGYSGKQAALVIKRTISIHPHLRNYDDLVQKALVEAANVYSPTDDN